eukprot:TRINITY_DN2177_c0_g1_i1.p1 TRINITY_DN2177_c0_g1~~TRINITY_DN2177_c0_g1_i1.p1  ORF type:complete len:113 (+),score=34.47 TRINITY_DN2177_c0_g1_i1:163-501(+)
MCIRDSCTLDQRVLHNDLDFHLGEKIDDVLGPAIKFGVPFLPSEALGFSHGDPLDPDFVQRFLYLVQLEGLDYGFDFFHFALLFSLMSRSSGHPYSALILSLIHISEPTRPY